MAVLSADRKINLDRMNTALGFGNWWTSKRGGSARIISQLVIMERPIAAS